MGNRRLARDLWAGGGGALPWGAHRVGGSWWEGHGRGWRGAQAAPERGGTTASGAGAGLGQHVDVCCWG